MRLIILAAAALVSLTAAASAAVLPIHGRYCNASVAVDANGLWSEEDAAFDRVIKSGTNWWQVSYKDPDGYLQGVTARVSLSEDKSTLTLTDSDDTHPIILHRCPS